jgi:hypothetical protein
MILPRRRFLHLAAGTTLLPAFARLGFAPEIVNKISAAMNAAIAAPNVKERFVRLGVEPMLLTPEELKQHVCRRRGREVGNSDPDSGHQDQLTPVATTRSPVTRPPKRFPLRDHILIVPPIPALR